MLVGLRLRLRYIPVVSNAFGLVQSKPVFSVLGFHISVDVAPLAAETSALHSCRCDPLNDQPRDFANHFGPVTYSVSLITWTPHRHQELALASCHMLLNIFGSAAPFLQICNPSWTLQLKNRWTVAQHQPWHFIYPALSTNSISKETYHDLSKQRPTELAIPAS